MQVTYKALEQFSESEGDLDRLLAVRRHAAAATNHSATANGGVSNNNAPPAQTANLAKQNR